MIKTINFFSYNTWRMWLLLSLILLSATACGTEEPEETGDIVIPTTISTEPTPSPEAASTAVTSAQPEPTTLAPTELAQTPTLAPEATETAEGPPATLPPATAVIQPDWPLLTGQPALTHDLLFIADGALKRWSYRDGQVTTLLPAEGKTITTFSISDDGERLVAARLLADPQEELYELIRLDLRSGENWLLVSNVPWLLHLDISPNGRQALYIAGDPPPPPDDTEPTPPAPAGDIFQVDIESRGTPVLIGRCDNTPPVDTADVVTTRCSGAQWTQDGQNVVWADAQGIWLRHQAATEATLVLPNKFDLDAGINLTIYFMRDWSPNGRYLLLTASQWEGARTVILDLATNQAIDVPESTVSHGTGYVQLDWMQDGRLLVMREQTGQTQNPQLQLWRLSDENGQFTLEETTFLGFSGPHRIQSPHHFANGRFGFTLLADNEAVSGLYLMASSNEPPLKVNHLPFERNIEVTWLPDATGAMVSMRDRQDTFLYLPANAEGEAIFYDVRPHIGQEAAHFYWLPPLPER